MDSNLIREKFISFFKSRDHAVVPSSSLIPDDPSVLLTTAGMQQFKPYFLGQADAVKDFGRPNTVSVQKSFRTSDIDEVGDDSHLTFFEMLGNFSFGGYFKETAIKLAYEFITKELNLAIDKVTVFDPRRVPAGDWRKSVALDEESYLIWKDQIKLPADKIVFEGVDNFWGPTGSEGPCGPTTEIYIKTQKGESVEIWNLVFNEFYCDKQRKLSPLKPKGIDTGMGFERLIMVVQNKNSVFETDLFQDVFGGLTATRSGRIIADHLRGACFLINDGILPSNKEAGYVLRRLIRRLVFHAQKINLPPGFIKDSVEKIAAKYQSAYPQLTADKEHIIKVIEAETSQFLQTLEKGIYRFRKDLAPLLKSGEINWPKVADLAFDLYQTFGLPVDLVKDLIKESAAGFDEPEFNRLIADKIEKHKEISRANREKKFGGHGLALDTGELKAGTEEEIKKVVRLHTATHLLQQALRDVLGPAVKQMGSDITPERTRFDFSFDRRLTEEEIKRVEEIVNQKIKDNLPVKFEVMPKAEAEKLGALSFFKEKYPDSVKVYYVGETLSSAYSKEFCGGPHVSSTGEIGRFKITKQKSVGRGLKRIKAVID